MRPAMPFSCGCRVGLAGAFEFELLLCVAISKLLKIFPLSSAGCKSKLASLVWCGAPSGVNLISKWLRIWLFRRFRAVSLGKST
jgi:hypothetical protein